jgi:hypothetical protein
LGIYVSVLGQTLRIEYRNGSLVIVSPDVPPVLLEPTDDPEAFLATSGRMAGELAHVRHREDGMVVGFTSAGFPYRKLVEADG